MKNPSIKLYYKTCKKCNTPFTYYAYPSTEKKQPRKTCSKECQYSYNRRKAVKIDLICKFCNKSFYVLPCHSHKKFCSNKCRINWQKTLTGERNPSWRPIRENATYRSIKTTLRNKLINSRTLCGDCGRYSEVFEIHHIDKNRDNNKIENLIVLCKSCHANRHKGERAYNLILKSENHKRQQKRIRKSCKLCGAEFILYNKNLKFCSRKCAAIYNHSKK